MLRILNRESENVKHGFGKKAKKLTKDFVQGE